MKPSDVPLRLNPVSEPPDKEWFSSLSTIAKMQVLAMAWQDQTANLLSCNADKAILQEWVVWLEQTYPDNNKKDK